MPIKTYLTLAGATTGIVTKYIAIADYFDPGLLIACGDGSNSILSRPSDISEGNFIFGAIRRTGLFAKEAIQPLGGL
ncbi:MAG: hypothetical protein GDA53_02485 [Rhodobacteraceae bacterium]|nr:hypothetical protein [Paracoccaceae bacterium]